MAFGLDVFDSILISIHILYTYQKNRRNSFTFAVSVRIYSKYICGTFLCWICIFNMIIISYNAFNNLTIASSDTQTKNKKRDVFVWMTADLRTVGCFMLIRLLLQFTEIMCMCMVCRSTCESLHCNL